MLRAAKATGIDTMKLEAGKPFTVFTSGTWTPSVGWQWDAPLIVPGTDTRVINDYALPILPPDDDTDTRPMDAASIIEAIRKSK